MCTRRTPSPAAWAEVCEAVDGVPTPARASSTTLQSKHVDGNSSTTLQSNVSNLAVETFKEKARIKQELESDRRFFADPPEDYVRCPTCSIVYAVNSSRPVTPTDLPSTNAPMIPACYSKDLPRGANLSLEDATRHLHRSRFRCGQCDSDFCRCGVSPYHWGWSCEGWHKHEIVSAEVCPIGCCRWCSAPCMQKLRRSESLASSCCGNDDGNDLKRFPPALSCAEKERRACGKRHHDCGHFCSGIRGEDTCLPCLNAECVRRKQALCAVPSSAPPPPAPFSLTSETSASEKSPAVISAAKLPEGDDWCPICWTESLSAAPSIRLHCGHVMHHHCAEALVRKGHTAGRRLTFKSIRCPLCQAIIKHASLRSLVNPLCTMYQKVRRKALQRWVVEQRRPVPRLHDHADEDTIASLAMTKMTFYECSQCNEPYYGGEVECGGAQAEEEEDLDEDVQAALAMELVCRGCASKGQLQCPEHGTEFLGWKCRYCCEREAHYFCFGTTHFCYVCHDLWQTGVEQRRKLQAGKPCLGKDRCIFGGRHPPGSRNGRDEYALGCTICAQDTECGILVASQRRSITRRNFRKNCEVM